MNVAVVGAGITGLTVAKALQKQNVNVTVFEKSRGLGGRLATKRLEWASLDIGAQYFTARDERFKEQLNNWLQNGAAAQWNFCPYISSDDHLARSPDDIERFVGVPNMNSLTHDLARGLTVHCKTRITNLKPIGQGWRLEYEGDDNFSEEYSWVVLCLPADQSKALLTNTNIAHSIPDNAHQPSWAIALETHGNVSPKIQGFFGDRIVSWVSRLSSRPNKQEEKEDKDLWMLHFSGEWSEQNGKETPIDVVNVGFEWLQQALKDHTDQPLELTHSYKHFWRYARSREAASQTRITIDTDECIAALGDWSYGGRVEGAYLAALDFVDQYFNSLQK